MAVIDVVKLDMNPGEYAAKFFADDLSTWTQLIVSETQEAILVKEGRMFGPFLPGRYTLSTKNFPVLSKFVKIPFGGKTPFTAEVWFVQKTEELDLKWGTQESILIKDPVYEVSVPIQIFGQFGLVVQDSKRFLKRLVGTAVGFNRNQISSYFKSIVLTQAKTSVANVLIKDGVSVLDIASELVAISEALESSLRSEFAEFGLRLLKFRVQSIGTDNDDPSVQRLRSVLDEKARKKILGMDYKEIRSFDIMEGAANNEGGGIAGAGLGLGFGVGAGIPFGQSMGAAMSGSMTPDVNQKSPCDKCGKDMETTAKFCPHCGDIAIRCPACGRDNEEGAVQCLGCGISLVQAVNCDGCGGPNPGDAKFCCRCGKTINIEPSIACPDCGTPAMGGASFCGQCGKRFNEGSDEIPAEE